MPQTPDEQPSEIDVPDDFAAALRRDARAKEAFSKLPRSHKREHVLAIEEAKKAETRARRIAKAIAMLTEAGPKQGD